MVKNGKAEERKTVGVLYKRVIVSMRMEKRWTKLDTDTNAFVQAQTNLLGSNRPGSIAMEACVTHSPLPLAGGSQTTSEPKEARNSDWGSLQLWPCHPSAWKPGELALTEWRLLDPGAVPLCDIQSLRG